MNGIDENQDVLALKALLTSWHVGILFEFFKDEDITIRELKMMDYSHIHSLLKDYKMGVKIRFEYNLKSWRHKLGIPLKTFETNHHSHCCCNKNSRESNNIIDNQHTNNTTITNSSLDTGLKRKRLNIDIEAKNNEDQDLNQSSLSPQSINSNASMTDSLNPNVVFNFGNTTASTNEKAHNTDNEIDMNVPLQVYANVPSDFDNNTPPKFHSKIIQERYAINVQQILRMAGSRGMAILKFFKAKSRLTNVHRTQLIQIIVDYFIDNDYHLSLNLSHTLEWEILKMFPTEKLEYYRTEKRGKIYSKFSNMKRYKRDRNLKANTEVEMPMPNSKNLRRKTDEFEITNLPEENSDSCYTPFDPEIVIKEENKDD